MKVVLEENGTVRNSTTTDANGEFSLRAPEGRDYKATYTKTGYLEREELFVHNSNSTALITLEKSQAPYVDSAAPRGGVYVTDRTQDLVITVKDPNSDPINASIYFQQADGSYKEVANWSNLLYGETVSTEVESQPGTNRWYVELSDATKSRTSSTFTYEAPGYLTIYNDSDLTKIDGVTATIVTNDGSFRDVRTSTNGNISFEGIPNKPVLIKLEKSGYSDRTLSLDDLSQIYTTVMLPTSGSGSDDHKLQGFELQDQTGNYPCSESTVLFKKYYLDKFRLVTAGEFSSFCLTNVNLTDGETYRVIVKNDDGDRRDLSLWTYDDANQPDPIPIVIEPTDGDDGDDGDTDPGEPTNNPPIADYVYTPSDPVTYETVTFDGTNSSDSDGQVVVYRWDYGNDGTFEDTGAMSDRTFKFAGNYTVRLQVEDDDGATDNVTKTFFVAADGEAPTALFDVNKTPYVGIDVELNASYSADPDGSIQHWNWTFEDPSGTITTTNKTTDTLVKQFGTSGLWNITLTVEDNDGLTDSRTDKIYVGSDSNDANAIPDANFTYTPNNPDAGETVTFNASTSSDSDGTIDKYEWDFDADGEYEKTGEEVTYSFERNETYTVTLQVTDNRSSQDTESNRITVGSGEPTQGPNEPPVADFEYSPSSPDAGDTVTFNASASSDPDGTIVAYRWDFDGDGTFEKTGKNVTKAWPSAGTYQVTLEVEDNLSTTDTKTVEITVGGTERGSKLFVWDAEIIDSNESDDEATIRFTFEADPDADVSDFELYVFEYQNRSNNTIYSENIGSTNEVVVDVDISGDQLNKTWVVQWNATIETEPEGGRERLSLETGETPTSQWEWIGVMALLFITVLTSLYSNRLAAVGSVILVASAGVLMWFKFLYIPAFAWWVALVIAVITAAPSTGSDHQLEVN